MSKVSYEKKTVTLGAVGDICLAVTCGRQIQENGLDWPFEKMLPHWDRADLLFGNLESVVLPLDYPQGQIDPVGLVSKFDATAALKLAGFDFLNLASNHVLDGGSCGMFHTQKLLEAMGIATAGIGQTQHQARQMRVLNIKGLRIGFLCYCEDGNYTLGTTGPCHAYYTSETVLEDIAANRHKVDVLIVSVHADLENMETPSMPRREDFRKFARAGASIVLGHHPHVPQGIELLDGALIAYSLGNFYFLPHTMPWMKNKRPHTAHSFLLLVELSQDGIDSFTRVPFEIPSPPPQMRPTPLKNVAADKMLTYLEELDRKCRDDETVSKNWREISLRHLYGQLKRLPKTGGAPKGFRGRLLRKYLGKHLEQSVPTDLDSELNNFLGRLLLVAENRNWVEEVIKIVKINWADRCEHQDPYHKPSYSPKKED